MAKKIPKISVLTTVYNGERFLMKTIDSVLNQSFKDFEYVIVNDGSTDNTEKIIKEYMKKDKRIIYIKLKENKGSDNLGNVINIGLKKCEGRYIARLDADDICYKDRLEKQFSYLEKHKKIFLVGSSADIINKIGNKIGNMKKWQIFPILIKIRILDCNNIIHSSIMFRNERLIYPNRHEHLFYLDLIRRGKKLVNMKNTLVRYRINPHGLMAKDADLSKNKFRELWEDKN
jgi:glycosyltransferase involved in cell wall biosynthesis